MPTATLTSKGQITLPSELRRSLSLSSGDQIEFFLRPTPEDPGRSEEGEMIKHFQY